MTPEGATSMSSIASSLQSSSAGPLQQERGSIAASTTSNFSSVSNSVEEGSSSSHAIPTASAIEYRLAKTMDPAAFKRASLALQEAIKELEDDTEDEIVLPRSPPPRGHKDDGVDMVSVVLIFFPDLFSSLSGYFFGDKIGRLTLFFF